MQRKILEEIIANKIGESDTLEFKEYYFDNGKLNSLEQRHLSALLKEICSFANSNGGKIVIGIMEDNDHNPAGFSDVGVNETTFETWEQSLRNKIATTTIPSIYNIDMDLVSIDNETHCIIIDIPRSILKPHAFNTGTKDEFYIRNGNICTPMRYNDIRTSFNALEFKQEKVRRFIDERLSFILSGYLDDSLSVDSSLVLHIIPEWSLDESNFLDLKSLQFTPDFNVISPQSRLVIPAFNADGLIKTYGSESRRRIMSYIQIFTNACIESVVVSLLNDYEDGMIFNWGQTERMLVESIYQYFQSLKSLRIVGGYYFTITLLNVRGKRVKYNSWGDYSEPLIHDVVRTPILKYIDNESFDETVFPILTSLAYCFGLPNSNYYGNDNKPIPERFEFIKKETENLN
ncbi:MAG TPA: ATP-binding protein [Bacillota bacterium]|nr:ATP-binding protein [Bacillota bacterium]